MLSLPVSLSWLFCYSMDSILLCSPNQCAILRLSEVAMVFTVFTLAGDAVFGGRYHRVIGILFF